MENYFFLENHVTLEGPVSHIVLNYQHLPITHYQVRVLSDNYFELLPIVSTAFKRYINACYYIVRFSVSESHDRSSIAVAASDAQNDIIKPMPKSNTI